MPWQRSCDLEVGELGFETRSSDSNANQRFSLPVVFTTLESLASVIYGLCELDGLHSLFILRFCTCKNGN